MLDSNAPTSTTGATLGSTEYAHLINNPKSATVTTAQNGFVIQLQRVSQYGQDYSVATTPDEITSILAAYFAA